MAAEVIENGVEHKVEDKEKQKVSDRILLSVLLMKFNFRTLLLAMVM